MKRRRKPSSSRRRQHLDAAAAGEAPLLEAVVRRAASAVGVDTAPLSGEHSGGVVQALDGDRDVIEENCRHGALILDYTRPAGQTRRGRLAMSVNMEEKFQTLHEIVKAARQNLAPGPWDYLIGGAESETTLKRNRQAIDSLALRPRVLRDVSKIDTGATLPRPAPAHPRDAGARRLDRELRSRRRRRRRQGLGGVRRAADALVGLQSRARGHRRRRRQLPHLPALRARRRRAGWTTTSSARATTATPPSASPWTPPPTAAASATSPSASSSRGACARADSTSRRRCRGITSSASRTPTTSR